MGQYFLQFAVVLFLFFAVHAFFGWVLESVYRSFHSRAFVNAGFLYGPFVPLYGFGALIIYFTSIPLPENPIWIQIPMYTVLITALEYFVSWLMEKAYSFKLWDYSKNKLNINGRVCLKFSLFWAVLAILQNIWIQPFVMTRIEKMHPSFKFSFAAILMVYFLIDLNVSSKLFLWFSRIIREALTKIKAAEIFVLLKKNLSGKDIHRFLLPIRKFPNLSFRMNQGWDYFSSLVFTKITEWTEDIMHSEQARAPEKKLWSEDDEFTKIAAPIMEHEEYRKLMDYHHHENSIYQHNIDVAYLAYRMGKALKLKEKDIIRGALLHDFFHYNWRTHGPDNGKKHAWEHPRISLRNARRYFGPLTPVEKDIIIKHMWPLSLVPPFFPESFIVTLADKIIASKEFTAEFFTIGKGKDSD